MPVHDLGVTPDDRGPDRKIDGAAAVTLTRSERRRFRRHGTANLFRMGHCAPAVVKTILDVRNVEDGWLVKLASGLPGGIGNTGFECGGVVGALVSLGLRYGRASRGGLPVVVWKGHDYCRRFLACNGSLLCRDIRGHARLPLRCIRAVRRATELHAQTVACDGGAAIPAGATDAYRRLHAHLLSNRFHCAHAVLEELRDAIPVTQELLDATCPLVGGTVYQGMTCGALTAGVVALGLEAGAIEDSRVRVLRMIALLAVRGRALDDDVNAFNRAVKLGHGLARWFTSVFGGTQCRALTGCDPASLAAVERYVESGRLGRCRAVAAAVAARVRSTLALLRAGSRLHEPPVAPT